MTVRDELQARVLFEQRYGIAAAPVARPIELYLAARTGCRVVLADLPLDGLRSAAARAQAEGLVARASVLAATGGLLRRALVFARRA